jgi:hypothetical protein
MSNFCRKYPEFGAEGKPQKFALPMRKKNARHGAEHFCCCHQVVEQGGLLDQPNRLIRCHVTGNSSDASAFPALTNT